MPKIAEIREIDGEIWVRIGKLEDHESGVALWSPEEQARHRKTHYNIGYEDATEGRPKEPW